MTCLSYEPPWVTLLISLDGMVARRFLRDIAVLGMDAEAFAERLISRHYRGRR